MKEELLTGWRTWRREWHSRFYTHCGQRILISRFYDHHETMGMGAGHLGRNTTLETHIMLGTTQRRLGTFFDLLCIFLLQYTFRLHHFSLHSVGVTIPNCQAAKTADTMDMGAPGRAIMMIKEVYELRGIGYGLVSGLVTIFVKGILATCIGHIPQDQKTIRSLQLQ